MAANYYVTFGEHPRKPTFWNVWFQQWSIGEALWWFWQQYHGILLVALLTFTANLLQGSINQGTSHDPDVISQTAMLFLKMTMTTFIQLKLFNRGFKSMKINFNVFPTQKQSPFDLYWTSLVNFIDCSDKRIPISTISKATCRCSWRRRYNILLDAVHNLYESIPRRTAAVFKARDGPIPHQQQKCVQYL
jgi:hypothetical protein